MDNFGLDGVPWQDVKAVSVEAVSAGSPKPYDAEVEYLESTGTQWIDTGILGSGDLDFMIWFSVKSVPSSGGAGTVFGSRTEYNSNAYQFTTYKSNKGSGGHFDFGALGINNNYMSMVADTKLFAGKVGLNITRCDGSSFNISSQSFSTPTTIALFALHYAHGGTGERINGCRIYRCTFSQSGSLIRDFIPVRKNGIGYLFDRVSGTLFGKQGTDEFLYGADVSPVVQAVKVSDRVWYACPYVKDGLIAWFDGIWNVGVGIHDADATSWKDLVGGIVSVENATIPSGESPFSVGEDHMDTSSRFDTIVENTSSPMTIEICSECLKVVGTNNNSRPCYVVLGRRSGGIQGNAQNRCAHGGKYNGAYGVKNHATPIPTKCTQCRTWTEHSTCESVYLDGVKVTSSFTFWDSENPDEQLGERVFGFGNHNTGTAGTRTRVFSVRMYNRVLTADEAAANHLVDKARFSLPA